jgi:hypothetical protein
VKHDNKTRMPAQNQSKPPSVADKNQKPKAKNQKPKPTLAAKAIQPIERSVYNRPDSVKKPQTSPGSAASPPRTTWNPNLPAARANGFSNYR